MTILFLIHTDVHAHTVITRDSCLAHVNRLDTRLATLKTCSRSRKVHDAPVPVICHSYIGVRASLFLARLSHLCPKKYLDSAAKQVANVTYQIQQRTETVFIV